MTFWNLAVSNPDAPAVGFGRGESSGGSLSYRQLAAKADEFHEQAGRSSHKRLGAILCRNVAEALFAYLGALRAGDAVMLLNEQTAPSLLTSMVDAYRPDWLFRPESSQYPPGYSSSATIEGWQYLLCRSSIENATLPRDLGVLLSTSGTTGSPQMVRLSRTNVASNAKSIVEYLKITPDDRAITTLPFSYSYGMSVLNSHLEAGATLILSESSLMTRDFWEEFSFHGVTSLAGVPYTYQMLHRLNPHRLDLASLRTLTQAGGRLSLSLTEYFRKLAEQKHWRFYVMYGQTEAAPRISYVPPEMLASKAGSIGIPIPGGHLYVTDEAELVYEGPNVMLGYALCRDDLHKGDELNGRLRTGDLGSVDHDSYFFLHGRLKRFIKVHGNRVSLDDIEHRLEEQLRCQAAAVGEDDRLKIFVSGGADINEARKLIAELYRLHQTTFVVGQIEDIPFNASGKKDYSGLPQ